jgi:hypothetical protein
LRVRSTLSNLDAELGLRPRHPLGLGVACSTTQF